MFGGTAAVSRNLIALFSEALDVAVCCLQSEQTGDYPMQVNGATVLAGKVASSRRVLKVFLDFAPESFANRQFHRRLVRERFSRLLADTEPEVVIFDHIYSSWLIDLVPKSRARTVYIAHDDMVAYADSLIKMEPDFFKKARFTALRGQYLGFQERLLKRCDRALALTPQDAGRLSQWSAKPIEVAPLFFEFPPAARSYSQEFSYLLATGSFDTWEKRRGLSLFIEEVYTPLRRTCPGLRLVVAGRMPEEFKRSLPVSEPILKVLDGLSEAQMAEVFRDASAAVVLDLQVSGLKIKTMELAAAGLPIVTWQPGFEGTTLQHGASCLVAASASEFVTHLEYLYRDPAARMRLGMQARATLTEHFSREAALTRAHASGLFGWLEETSRAVGA